MKKKVVSTLFVILSIVLSVVSWLLLPETVVVQVGIDGQVTNTMPKILAVIIPLGVTVVGAVMNLTGTEEINKKAYTLSVVGVAVTILTLIFNL